MLKKIIPLVLPWRIKRWYLNKYFGYEIHSSAKIGLAWVYPHMLVMGPGACIGHFTVAIHLDHIEMGRNAIIGRNNWITGLTTKNESIHFRHQPDRKAELYIGDESAITKNHHIDCSNRIEIGRFATIAGYQTQLLTHSINLLENRQDSEPIVLGDYTFIGTNCVVLGGAKLPPYSVLGAKSLLNKSFDVPYTLYAGVPAKPISQIPKDAKYFDRKTGFVK